MTRWESEVPTEYAEQVKLAEYLDRKGTRGATSQTAEIGTLRPEQR